MTEHEVNKIDLERENDSAVLKKIIKFWQDKVYNAELRLSEIKGYISDEKIAEKLDIRRLKEIIEKAR
jgi:hypothetical protein